MSKQTAEQRSVRKLHPAVREDIADLITHRALPTRSINQVDPFLFLNHHGPQIYPPGNRGLPFGPHPHRGFETITFILEGDIAHRDTGGHESIINAGGVQWMTAGRGLIHSEVSSEAFKKSGGNLEILQLWVNLPAKLKMTDPAYIGIQKSEIPTIDTDEARVTVSVISGEWSGHTGKIKPLTDIQMMMVSMKKGGRFNPSVAPERNIFLYVVRGEIEINGQKAQKFHLVDLANDGALVDIQAQVDSFILFGHAQPLNEPVVSHGPFVMNTKEEILEAIQDYQAGKMNG